MAESSTFSMREGSQVPQTESQVSVPILKSRKWQSRELHFERLATTKRHKQVRPSGRPWYPKAPVLDIPRGTGVGMQWRAGRWNSQRKPGQ